MHAALFYENVAAGGWRPSDRLLESDMGATASHAEEPFVREAVRRVLDGDIEAFAVLVNTHQRLIAADLARRLPPQDVQEVAQDAFLRAFRSLRSYRGDAPFRVWLLRIGRHAAMDFWRKHYRRRDRVFTDLDEAAQREVETTQQARLAEARADREARETAREWLEAALTRLSPDDRAVITLVELEERTMEEAARRLDCGLSAIKVRAFRARRRLKAVLDELRPGKEEKP